MNTENKTELSHLFKNGLRKLASGVSLVTTGRGDRRNGLIMTAVNSVSAEPPSLLICINETASAHDTVGDCGRFCVNFLSVADGVIAGQFSSSSRRSERFATGDWTQSEAGLPVLRSALSAFDCEVVQSVKFGTHTLFIGTVTEVLLGDQDCEPLVYLDRTFRSGASPELVLSN